MAERKKPVRAQTAPDIAVESVNERNPDAAQQETRVELDDGTIELRRPILHESRRGDWQNPWREPGYLVYHECQVDPQDGVRRDGDHAVRVVEG